MFVMVMLPGVKLLKILLLLFRYSHDHLFVLAVVLENENVRNNLLSQNSRGVCVIAQICPDPVPATVPSRLTQGDKTSLHLGCAGNGQKNGHNTGIRALGFCFLAFLFATRSTGQHN